MTKLFTGVATALATPMTPNGGIDYDSYRRLLNFQIDAGRYTSNTWNWFK